jgi:hypothetical protein
MSAADAAVGDADGGSIGINLDTGMGLVFVIKHELPSEHDRNGYKFNLDEAEMELRNLRLVADSVADGDERTTMPVLAGLWMETMPQVPALYPDAPPGLYSRIRGTVAAFEVEGEVEVDGTFYDLEVETGGLSVPFELAINYNLEPGSPLLLEVEIDLQKVMDEVEYDLLPIVDGEILIENDATQAMDKIEEKLGQAFEVVGEL